MQDQAWDTVYKEQGKVQKDVLPTVVTAAQRLKAAAKKKILDLCCGTGRHTVYLAGQGFQVSALDISSEGVDITRKNAEELGLRNIDYYVSDRKNTPFSDNYFEGIVCLWSNGLGMRAEMVADVQEMYRILQPGGLLITDFVSVQDRTYGRGRELEHNTYLGSFDGLPDLVNHYCNRAELEDVLSDFSSVQIEPFVYTYDNGGKEDTLHSFVVEAVK